MNHPTSHLPWYSRALSLVLPECSRLFSKARQQPPHAPRLGNRSSPPLWFGGPALLLALILNLAPAAAQGALGGNWRLNGNGYLGTLSLTQHSNGSLFGSMYNEPVRGFYSSAEGVFVLVRGTSYSAPTQAFVGRYRAPFSKGQISSPATLSGTFYALDAAAGATWHNNQFSFTAVPESYPYPALTPLPPLPPSAFSLGKSYTLVNRPAEFGNTWTVPLKFNNPTGEFTGLLSGDSIRGYYSPGSSLVVFVRTMSSVGFMPNQLFVGQARTDYGLVVDRIIDGRFYALDTWGGASSQRLTYDWRAE